MTKTSPKPKNYQNTLKPKKLPKHPRNLKMTKILPKPKKWQKYLGNPKNDQNTPKP